MIGVVAIAVLGAGAIVVAGGSRSGDEAAASVAVAAEIPSMMIPQVEVAADDAVADQAAPSVDLDGCVMDVTQVLEGDSGENVECVQKALYAAGYYDGEITGEFDRATDGAARKLQDDRRLYTDGIVGARTAESLGIWPGEESFVVRTASPSPGTLDSWGFALSSVSSAGTNAPPMPENSGQGTGKRVVYDRAGQRVWAVDDEENVVRSYLVTGSQYRNEVPGRHQVYSRSVVTTAWNGAADLPLMVRWLKTERGAIGFHAIPTDKSTGELYQTADELGHRGSGGCQRQTQADAEFMWEFAQVGTNVYVT
jgi:peptidoglycan hydrolase-like protein with peptidoglycan-binding domain